LPAAVALPNLARMQIKSAEFVTSAKGLAGCPVWDLPEFAFIGRSNVGKSSMINMLSNRHALAKVSATPGKTRLKKCCQGIRGKPGQTTVAPIKAWRGSPAEPPRPLTAGRRKPTAAFGKPADRGPDA
jgi:hypothetical protein